MAHLSLSLLGPFQAALDGQSVMGLESRARALLAYLAAESGRPHAREALAGLLWPDCADRAALSNLRYALSNLREAIGDRQADPPFLLITRDTIQFNPASDHSIDLSGLEDLTDLETDRLVQVASAHRGSFLEGFSCDSAPFEEWVLVKREQINQQLLDALRRLATHFEQVGQHDLTITWARRQLELEPWDEEAHRQLMRSLAQGGQRNAALAQYEACRRVLKQELGVEPSRETRTLYESIRDGTFTTRAPTNVPVPVTSFIGREKEQKELKELLSRTRLLTLSGTGGCGKTRLALQVAAELANASRYKEGVWWVDLAALTDPALVPQTVASVLGVRESPQVPILIALCGYLRAKEILLVLDNCEHLTDACASLAQTLLNACPRLQILATSRHTLGIGEVVWRVPSLALPEADAPFEQLCQYDAMQLFAARAIAVAPNWKLAEHAAIVQHICARLEGIPLALELAAARVRMLSVRQIAERLDDRFRLLTDGSRAALPRHQTLRATMEWSYALLSDAERALLRRLSVFAGGFSIEVVEAVCSERAERTVSSDSEHAERTVDSSLLNLLAALVDKSLVIFEELTGQMRYRMLETIRQYAREKLDESGEAAQVSARHLEFLLRFAERAEPGFQSADQKLWFDCIEIEHDNLRAALEWAATNHKAEELLRLTGALWRFWWKHGHPAEGRKWLGLALELGSALPAHLRARAMNGAAVLAWAQDDHEMSRRLHEACLRLRQELDDRPGIATSLSYLGLLAMDRGDQVEARNLYEASLKLRRELGDQAGIATVLNNLGLLAWNQGDFGRANAIYEESLTLNRGLGNRFECATVLYNLALVAYEQLDFDHASSLSEESLALSRELGYKERMACSLGLQGHMASCRGDHSQATTLLESSLTLFRELGHHYVDWSLEMLAYASLHRGALPQAAIHFKECLASGREQGNLYGQLMGLTGCAATWNAQKRPADAIRLLSAVEAIGAASNYHITATTRVESKLVLTAAHGQLDDTAFAEAWSDGYAMTLEQAVEFALNNSPQDVPP